MAVDTKSQLSSPTPKTGFNHSNTATPRKRSAPPSPAGSHTPAASGRKRSAPPSPVETPVASQHDISHRDDHHGSHRTMANDNSNNHRKHAHGNGYPDHVSPTHKDGNKEGKKDRDKERRKRRTL